MIYLVSNVASVHEFYQQVSSFSVFPVVSSAKKTLTYRRYMGNASLITCCYFGSVTVARGRDG